MTSNTPPAGAVAAIEAGLTRVTRRAEIYEADGETLWVPPNGSTQSRLVSGSINIDYNRDERRTVDLTLTNHDGMLASRNGEGFWYNKIIKAYRGVRYPNTDPPNSPSGWSAFKSWETQVGEFMIDRIGDKSSDRLVTVSGRDYTKKCLTSKLERSMSFPPGTYIYQLIKALAANAGITKFKLPYTNETLGATLDLERGTERWNVMKQAANSNNWDIFFDNQGYLTMTRYPDPAIDAPLMTFRKGAGGNLISWDKSVNDSRLYNHVVVFGDREAVEGGEILMPYFGEAINNDVSSPTNVDEIGDRYYSYASSFFTSDEQCQKLAQSWLKIYSLESYEINWNSFVYPWLDAGKVVDVLDPTEDIGVPTRFLLDTLDIPLDLGTMNATGKRVLAMK